MNGWNLEGKLEITEYNLDSALTVAEILPNSYAKWRPRIYQTPEPCYVFARVLFYVLHGPIVYQVLAPTLLAE